MTAPPDPLESVLAAFPRELHLRPRGTGFVLQITAPDLNGQLFASRRDRIEGFAVAYEAMRNGQRNAPPRCAECGDSRTSHDMGSKVKPCGRYGCPCPGWEPAEGAAQ